ncbi:EAL domain-containing protein [Rheinheimera sediminis]|uniref:EAL domain-containing protein n=1 Tax=Rheinheimera sp. YQF-1 TaxID=2499626 RepID=UPI000FD761A9|nr:EAL domain-containing protein [Rheinheimera sp. YQF-1]RVT42811.1 EAL domain-containing protein [Rheinheimera sp. YQF-1]
MPKPAYPLTAIRIVLLYCCFALLCIFGSEHLLRLTVTDPQSNSFFGIVKGVAFVCLSGCLIYLMLATWRKQQFFDSEVTVRHKQCRLVLLILAFLLAIPALAAITKWVHGDQLKASAMKDLRTVTDIKKQQLELWLAERQYDIGALSRDSSFRHKLERYLELGDQTQRADLQNRLASMIAEHSFSSVLVYDAAGQQRFALGAPLKFDALAGWQNQPQPSTQCDSQGTDRYCQLNWYLQLATGQQIYQLVFSVDTSIFLFPAIQNWPVSSPTAEVLLVQRQDQSVVFLNPLRHPQQALLNEIDTALDGPLLAAKALRQRQFNTAEALDYRRQLVLGAYTPVRQTNWMLVSKIDVTEVLQPLDTLLLWLSVSSGTLLMMLITGALFYWRELIQSHQLALAAKQTEQDKTVQAFFDLPFSGMAILSRTHLPFIRVNKKLQSVLGYSETELMALSLRDLAHHSQQFTPTSFATAEQNATEADVQLRHSTGKVLTVKLMMQRFSQQGQPDLLLATFEDVTEKRQLYADLNRSHQEQRHNSQQLDSILTASSTVLHRIDLDGVHCKTSWVSSNVERLFGYSVEECLMDKWWENSLHQDDKPFASRAIEQTLLYGHYRHEYRFYDASGSVRYIRDDLRLLPVQTYTSQQIIGAMVDITELKQARFEQEVSSTKLKTLFNTMSEGLVLHDATGAIVDANPSAELMLHSSLDEMRGLIPQVEDWHTIYEDGSEFPAELYPSNEVLRTSMAVRDVVMGIERDGVQRWLNLNAEPLFEQDQLSGALVTIDDISSEVAIRRELKQRALVMSNLADMVARFLQHSDWLQLLRSMMPSVSRALAVDAIYLYQNTLQQDRVTGTLLTQWRRDQKEHIRTFKHLDHKVSRWYPAIQQLTKGAVVAGLAQDMDQMLQPMLKRFRIQAIALVPVMVDGEWWGLLGVEQHHSCREWNQVELDALKMLATALGNAVKRQQFESSLQQAAAVFESTREGIMVTDASNRIIQVNQSLLQMLGYEESEVLGNTPAMFASGRHDQHFYIKMWQELSTKGHWQGEVWNRRKNGEIYPELLSISTIVDTNQQITHYVAVFADITQLKASEQELAYLAHHDVLTDLPNRLLMSSRLQNAVDLAKRDQRQFAVLMMDLDRFKYINDSFGHPAGDELLKLVAASLRQRLRDIDTVARFGGDEFIILLEQLHQSEDAARFATDLINDMSQPWLLSNNVEVRIGASIGISIYPAHGTDGSTLLSNADAALYRAKEQGRGRFAYYSDDLTLYARQRIDLEARLRGALALQQLLVYYQPQTDIKTGRIVGAEALVRWNDPTEGLIPPAHFIPIAEDTGLIGAIGDWVLAETCRQGAAWRAAALPDLKLAVNLSSHQFSHGDIGAQTAQILKDTGFPAELLELELTESAIMSRAQQAEEVLSDLHQMGVNLAIDDFGTGYSSFAYLQRYQLDVLKIDKSFVDDVAHSSESQAIVAAIISMAHILGLKALAEGVEHQDQLDYLRRQGCDYYQGYLCSKPLLAKDFELLVRSQSSSTDRLCH